MADSVSSATRTSPRSSGDRALPSGGSGAGSNPAGGTLPLFTSSRPARPRCGRTHYRPAHADRQHPAGAGGRGRTRVRDLRHGRGSTGAAGHGSGDADDRLARRLLPAVGPPRLRRRPFRQPRHRSVHPRARRRRARRHGGARRRPLLRALRADRPRRRHGRPPRRTGTGQRPPGRRLHGRDDRPARHAAGARAGPQPDLDHVDDRRAHRGGAVRRRPRLAADAAGRRP